ncbi:MAG: hypothetical protein J5764_01370 [Bacteroidales bacterium]|nr:hypothetical protein [Bacteroidales bacterium]
MKRTYLNYILSGVGGFLLAWLLFAFTPAKALLPGYLGVHAKRDAIQNAIKIDSLENLLTRWELYVDNLQKALSGEKGFSGDSLLIKSGTEYLTDLAAEEAARQDSLLKETVKPE